MDRGDWPGPEALVTELTAAVEAALRLKDIGLAGALRGRLEEVVDIPVPDGRYLHHLDAWWAWLRG